VRSTILSHPFGKLGPMAVVSICRPVVGADFSVLVLRGLAEMGLRGENEGELCLELGLSAWIARSGECLINTAPLMLTMRAAVITASGIDAGDEPVPFRGVNPRLDVLNLAVYLRELIGRAATAAHCDGVLVVERALRLLRDQSPSTFRSTALG
jgi:hypothetical protein